MSNLQNKPILSIPKNAFAKVFDLVALIAYLGSIAYIIVVWSKLPDQVPAHFNALGEVDRWGSKWELILLPIISGFLALFLSFLEKHPEWHNYMNLNKNNVEFQYKNSILLINVVKNQCVLLFVSLSYQIVQIALGNADSPGKLLMPFFLFTLFASIVFFIVRSFKHK
ncbi:DUF1648 domain-containing protein [Sporosarcina sp. HYO08]|uniref:DUF1648 domain-containing protein n=1 Tax=Sporosarcina sp. HYO08 TaxID=1759557 RepID=UPI000794F75B|nr:DUF1648 domain-containing protein [Sporosarcina sp. HYO08]KXH80652.1 hypothetical protein AU377_07865 [Sporosarcina sp. HYO08]